MGKANSGSFKPGQSGNPGGMTKEARAARELFLRQFDEMEPEWREAYKALLTERCPQIVLDYTYRKLGKPVERVADATGAPDVNGVLTEEQILEVARRK